MTTLPIDRFDHRHLGPTSHDIEHMLRTIGVSNAHAFQLGFEWSETGEAVVVVGTCIS